MRCQYCGNVLASQYNKNCSRECSDAYKQLKGELSPYELSFLLAKIETDQASKYKGTHPNAHPVWTGKIATTRDGRGCGAQP